MLFRPPPVGKDQTRRDVESMLGRKTIWMWTLLLVAAPSPRACDGPDLGRLHALEESAQSSGGGHATASSTQKPGGGRRAAHNLSAFGGRRRGLWRDRRTSSSRRIPAFTRRTRERTAFTGRASTRLPCWARCIWDISLGAACAERRRRGASATTRISLRTLSRPAVAG